MKMDVGFRRHLNPAYLLDRIILYDTLPEVPNLREGHEHVLILAYYRFVSIHRRQAAIRAAGATNSLALSQAPGI
jgi:hypothetical protein